MHGVLESVHKRMQHCQLLSFPILCRSVCLQCQRCFCVLKTCRLCPQLDRHQHMNGHQQLVCSDAIQHKNACKVANRSKQKTVGAAMQITRPSARVPDLDVSAMQVCTSGMVPLPFVHVTELCQSPTHSHGATRNETTHTLHSWAARRASVHAASAILVDCWLCGASPVRLNVSMPRCRMTHSACHGRVRTASDGESALPCGSVLGFAGLKVPEPTWDSPLQLW